MRYSFERKNQRCRYCQQKIVVGGDYFCASHGKIIQGVIDDGGKYFANLYVHRKDENNLEIFVNAMKAFEQLYKL